MSRGNFSRKCNIFKVSLSKNYTPPKVDKYVKLERKVSIEDVKKLKLTVMPGFKLTWYYSKTEEKQENQYWWYSNLLKNITNQMAGQIDRLFHPEKEQKIQNNPEFVRNNSMSKKSTYIIKHVDGGSVFGCDSSPISASCL